MKDPMIYTGTSGLVLPVAKALYPQEFEGKSRLAYYSSLYNSIEINSSFYKLPMANTVRRWADDVLDGFRFTFKLSKTVTHIKSLDFNKEDIGLFINTINHAGDKKGCLLIQFPPGLQNHFSRLNELLEEVRECDPDNTWKIAIEFRHMSWYKENVYRLLEVYKASIVMHDLPASAPPADEYESDIVYLRFHGPGGKYRGSYEEDFLSEYAGYINDWKRSGKTVYVYFNNTMGDALNNLNTLKSYLPLNADSRY
jgi:uncharacterized protein YecE (DUF72 family)